jgi:hypothetical protein
MRRQGGLIPTEAGHAIQLNAPQPVRSGPKFGMLRRMAEWLILLLVVPAIVVPTVLLVGFTGCDFEHGAAPALPDTTFAQPLDPGPSPYQGDWEGWCLIQRIEAARLSHSGTQVRLTLRASPESGASIDRIYISQGPDPGSGDPYDALADLTEIYDRGSGGPFVLPKGEAQSIPPSPRMVSYNLDHERPLLIAVDFSAAPRSGIMYVDTDQDLPEEERRVAAYWARGAYARDPDRTVAADQQVRGRLYLIEKIEVR